MGLTVTLGVCIVLAGLLGLARGVRQGLLALAGTILAAALVDLWSAPIADWVRGTFGPEQPTITVFASVAGLFLLASAGIGYGAGALLPPAARSDLLDYVVGALVGLLNGALIVSYLLRYALDLWGGGAAAGLIAGAPIAGLLVRWLPWVLLAMVGGTGVLILVRLVRRQLARSGARAAARATSVATAPTLAEADRRLNDKIDQMLKK